MESNESVRYGTWEGLPILGEPAAMCSVCGKTQSLWGESLKVWYKKHPTCPDCGAQMNRYDDSRMKELWYRGRMAND